MASEPNTHIDSPSHVQNDDSIVSPCVVIDLKKVRNLNIQECSSTSSDASDENAKQALQTTANNIEPLKLLVQVHALGKTVQKNFVSDSSASEHIELESVTADLDTQDAPKTQPTKCNSIINEPIQLRIDSLNDGLLASNTLADHILLNSFARIDIFKVSDQDTGDAVGTTTAQSTPTEEQETSSVQVLVGTCRLSLKTFLSGVTILNKSLPLELSDAYKLINPSEVYVDIHAHLSNITMQCSNTLNLQIDCLQDTTSNEQHIDGENESVLSRLRCVKLDTNEDYDQMKEIIDISITLPQEIRAENDGGQFHFTWCADMCVSDDGSLTPLSTSDETIEKTTSTPHTLPLAFCKEWFLDHQSSQALRHLIEHNASMAFINIIIHYTQTMMKQNQENDEESENKTYHRRMTCRIDLRAMHSPLAHLSQQSISGAYSLQCDDDMSGLHLRCTAALNSMADKYPEQHSIIHPLKAISDNHEVKRVPLWLTQEANAVMENRVAYKQAADVLRDTTSTNQYLLSELTDRLQYPISRLIHSRFAHLTQTQSCSVNDVCCALAETRQTVTDEYVNEKYDKQCSSENRLLSNARSLVRLHLYDEAVCAFENLMCSASDQVQIVYEYADVCLKLNQRTKALSCAQQSLYVQPDYSPALELSLACYIESRQFFSAQIFYQLLYQSTSALSSRALIFLALFLHIEETAISSEHLFVDKAIQQESGGINALIDAVNVCIDWHLPQNALYILQEYCTKHFDPHSIEVSLARCRVKALDNKTSAVEQVSVVKDLVAQHPTHLAPLLTLSELQYSMRHWEAARQSLQHYRVLSAHNDDEDDDETQLHQVNVLALYRLGHLLRVSCNIQASIDVLEELVTIECWSSAAWISLAMSYSDNINDDDDKNISYIGNDGKSSSSSSSTTTPLYSTTTKTSITRRHAALHSIANAICLDPLNESLWTQLGYGDR